MPLGTVCVVQVCWLSTWRNAWIGLDIGCLCFVPFSLPPVDIQSSRLLNLLINDSAGRMKLGMLT